MTRDAVMSYIGSFQKGGAPVKDLSRIETLLHAVGDPQDQLQFVHIAGTNGKGSVVAFCSSALQRAGFCVGTLTSPYIRHFQDRIQRNGEDIPEEALCRNCAKVQAAQASPNCSQFEITLAIALLWFAEQKTDLVILETGIGGTLDATNVIKNPLACAITSISLDHVEILGPSLAQIAAQKAGIIKQGCPVVLSPDNPMDIICEIQQVAQEKHAQLVIPPMLDCHVLAETSLETTFLYRGCTYAIHMPGHHQIYNALTAIEVLTFLGMQGFLVPTEKICQAFSEVRVPGRTQILQRDPLVLLDGAHNPAGMLALTDLLRAETSEKNQPIYAVCGMMQNKDYKNACAILDRIATRVICVDDFTTGTVPAGVLADAFPHCPKVEMGTLRESMEKIISAAKEGNGIAVLCGSLYLVSAVLDIIGDNH